LLNGNSESQKVLDRYSASAKRPWMLAQTTIPSKAFNQYRCRKIFHDKTRFQQYISTNPALQKVLEGKLQPKEVKYNHKNIGNR
ncbi:hypothetical protein ACQP3F_25920, partial [Escherichia coli]